MLDGRLLFGKKKNVGQERKMPNVWEEFWILCTLNKTRNMIIKLCCRIIIIRSFMHSLSSFHPSTLFCKQKNTIFKFISTGYVNSPRPLSMLWYCVWNILLLQFKKQNIQCYNKMQNMKFVALYLYFARKNSYVFLRSLNTH